MLVMENPAGRATGEAIECPADIHSYSTYLRDSKHFVREMFRQRRHSLNGSRAALIAGLYFGGGIQ